MDKLLDKMNEPDPRDINFLEKELENFLDAEKA